MNRFIVINNSLVNVRHIVMAVDEADGTTAFHLDNGEVLHTQSSPELDDALMGIKHTVGIIPVRGLNAIMDDGTQQFQMPVRYLELTADGSCYPLDTHGDDPHWNEDYGFIGLVEAPDKR